MIFLERRFKITRFMMIFNPRFFLNIGKLDVAKGVFGV